MIKAQWIGNIIIKNKNANRRTDRQRDARSIKQTQQIILARAKDTLALDKRSISLTH